MMTMTTYSGILRHLTCCLILSTTLGSQIAKSSRNLACKPGETLIRSPWLYSNTQGCGHIISQVVDNENLNYRRECQRWLGSSLPDKIKDSYVTECLEYGNGTARYRAQVCCDGVTTGLRCMSCGTQNIQYDNPSQSYHTETCDHLGQVVTCSAGQVCQAAFVSTYPQNTRVEKRCADQLPCTNASQPGYCQHGLQTPTCTSCCTDAFCNYDVPVQIKNPARPLCSGNECNYGGVCTPDSSAPNGYTCACNQDRWGDRCQHGVCYPNPCHNRGDCHVNMSSSTNYTCQCNYGAWGDRCHHSPCYPSPCGHGSCRIDTGSPGNYSCTCNPGYFGDRCQYDGCTMNGGNPCWHNSRCQRLTSQPYYKCYCPAGKTGQYCHLDAPQCAESVCKNGGTCYDHGSNGKKCVCMDGTNGAQCEDFKQGCDGDGLLYLHSELHRQTSGNCTTIMNTIKNSHGLARDARRECLSHMGGSYQGDISYGSVQRVPFVELDKCDDRESDVEYKDQACCPGCFSSPCQNGGWCQPASQSGGQYYTCKCRYGYEGQHCEKQMNLCYAFGDPHYRTFDGATISYQGVGRYVFSRTKAGNQSVESFKVWVINQNRPGNERVSYTKMVEIEALGQQWRMFRQNANKPVEVQQRVRNKWEDKFPGYNDDGYKISNNGRMMRLQTSFDLAIETDGRWLTVLKLDSGYQQKVEGICGVFDGNPISDYVTRQGDDVSTVPDKGARDALIGDSWRISPNSRSDIENTVLWRLQNNPSPRNQPNCSAEDQAKFAGNGYCGLLKNQTGAFAACTARVASDNFYQSCMFDTCENADDDAHAKEAACGSLEVMAAECAQHGFAVDFRTAAGCPLTCPDGMVYKSKTSACVATCATPNAAQECNLPDTESCVCPDGLVLQDNACVPPDQCGCVDGKGRRYQIGENGRLSDCQRSYQCVNCTSCQYAVGELQVHITHTGCSSNDSVCRPVNNQYGCYAARVDGGWGEWMSWAQCPWPPTCPAGYQVRNRLCDNPAPNIGGHGCGDDHTDTRTCLCSMAASARNSMVAFVVMVFAAFVLTF